MFTPDWEYGPNRDRRGVTDGTSNLVTSYVRVKVSPRFFPARTWFMLGVQTDGKQTQADVASGPPQLRGGGYRVAVHESADTHSVRAFGCFTDELEDMWLDVRGRCGGDGGDGGVLDSGLRGAGFEVHLVDARATKQVSGRKSDVRDCQWIRELMSYGLLRGAFRPRDEDCVVRSYVRQRGRLVRERARCVQHMQKALTQMNVHSTRY